MRQQWIMKPPNLQQSKVSTYQSGFKKVWCTSAGVAEAAEGWSWSAAAPSRTLLLLLINPTRAKEEIQVCVCACLCVKLSTVCGRMWVVPSLHKPPTASLRPRNSLRWSLLLQLILGLCCLSLMWFSVPVRLGCLWNKTHTDYSSRRVMLGRNDKQKLVTGDVIWKISPHYMNATNCFMRKIHNKVKKWIQILHNSTRIIILKNIVLIFAQSSWTWLELFPISGSHLRQVNKKYFQNSRFTSRYTFLPSSMVKGFG